MITMILRKYNDKLFLILYDIINYTAPEIMQCVANIAKQKVKVRHYSLTPDITSVGVFLGGDSVKTMECQTLQSAGSADQ